MPEARAIESKHSALSFDLASATQFEFIIEAEIGSRCQAAATVLFLAVGADSSIALCDVARDGA